MVRAAIEDVFDIVADFERYPEFLSEIERAEILKRTKTTCEVAFTANLIQRVNYTLAFKLRRPQEISWKLIAADAVLKENDGSWALETIKKNFTELTFQVDIAFGVWMPKFILDRLMNDHLANMLEQFKERAEKQGSSKARKRRSKQKSATR